MNRLLVLVLATLTALLGLQPGTTTASAATYTYDAPALALVDIRASATAGNGQWARVGVRERSALALVQVRGASPTPNPGSVATEAGSASASASTIDDLLSGLSLGRSGEVRTVGTEAELDDLFSGLRRVGRSSRTRIPANWFDYLTEQPSGFVAHRSPAGPTIDIVKPGSAPIKVHVGS